MCWRKYGGRKNLRCRGGEKKAPDPFFERDFVMGRKRYLRTKQLAVIDDMFGGELSEGNMLAKHGVSGSTYSRWMADELFLEEVKRRMAGARVQSDILMARYSLMATAKLVQLTESEKQETARKACMSIIARPQDDKKQEQSGDCETDEDEIGEIPDEVACRLVAMLAEAKCKKN